MDSTEKKARACRKISVEARHDLDHVWMEDVTAEEADQFAQSCPKDQRRLVLTCIVLPPDYVPDSIWRLPCLKLGAQGKIPRSLPADLSQTIQELSFLDCVTMTSLPLEVCTLQNLQGLFFIGHRLESLPREMVQLKSLKRLLLYGSRLETVPVWVGRLPKLESVSFAWSDEQIGWLRPAGRLEHLLNCGLSEEQATPWTRFLTRGLYDPRLFLVIGAMALQF